MSKQSCCSLHGRQKEKSSKGISQWPLSSHGEPPVSLAKKHISNSCGSWGHLWPEAQHCTHYRDDVDRKNGDVLPRKPQVSSQRWTDQLALVQVWIWTQLFLSPHYSCPHYFLPRILNHQLLRYAEGKHKLFSPQKSKQKWWGLCTIMLNQVPHPLPRATFNKLQHCRALLMHLFAHKTKCLSFSLAWGTFTVSLSTSLFEKKNYDGKPNIEGKSQAQAGTC